MNRTCRSDDSMTRLLWLLTVGLVDARLNAENPGIPTGVGR